MPGLKRGISLADRGSNTARHNSPTVDQLRQAAAPAKPAAQVASRSTSTGRSAAPGYSALCTSTAAGGWVGCGGNVWGHVGSCGHPATTTTCTPGTWLVLQLPPASSPQGSDDDDWSDTQPLAAGPGSPGGGVLTPSDRKTTSTNGDCVGPTGGNAFFGIPGNPDQPPLDCGNENQAAVNASPADISQFPLVAEPGAGDYPDPAEKRPASAFQPWRAKGDKFAYADCIQASYQGTGPDGIKLIVGTAHLFNLCNVPLSFRVCVGSSQRQNPDQPQVLYAIPFGQNGYGKGINVDSRHLNRRFEIRSDAADNRKIEYVFYDGNGKEHAEQPQIQGMGPEISVNEREYRELSFRAQPLYDSTGRVIPNNLSCDAPRQAEQH